MRMRFQPCAAAGLLGLLGFLGCRAVGGVLGATGRAVGMSENQARAIEGAGEDMEAATSEMSLSDERDLGETVSLQAYATPDFGRPIRDERAMRFVNTLGAVVGRTSDRPLIPYFVAIVDTPRINAFATPGGYVFITKGAVLAMRSEAELACVVGHEIAHVTERHALGTLRRGRAFQALGRGLAAATDTDMAEFDALVKDMCSSLLNNAFDQDKELAADVKGVSFALNAGYDPRAMIDFIDTIERRTGELSGGLSSHPEPEDRREAIQEMLEELPAGSLDGLVRNTDRFATFQSWVANPRERW